ncbi:NAD(P)-binding protein [Clavulina sp. PMI_390]|nr:NAD(P)-binding protein [Clavulina sp. PMI_390]
MSSPALRMSPPQSNAKGSVVVITGGSSGIGLAVAKAFLAAGARGVVISGRSRERLDIATKVLLDECPLNGGDPKRVLARVCEIISWDDNVALMKAAFETYGEIDYVFANALHGGDVPDWRTYDIFAKPDVSYTTAIVQSVTNTVHAAIPYLASHGDSSGPIYSMDEYAAQAAVKERRDKAIVVTGSEVVFSEFDPMPTYQAGKAAVHSLVWANRSWFDAVGVRLNGELFAQIAPSRSSIHFPWRVGIMKRRENY